MSWSPCLAPRHMASDNVALAGYQVHRHILCMPSWENEFDPEPDMVLCKVLYGELVLLSGTNAYDKY